MLRSIRTHPWSRAGPLVALQTGLLGAALVAGAIVGAASGGRLADRYGRKSVFLVDSAEPRQARLCAIVAELSGRSIRLDEPFALRALAINPLEQKNHERLRTRTASRAYRNFSAQLCHDMIILTGAAGFSALTWDAWWLIAAQLLVGVGIGMDFPVSSSYVAECMPHEKRSRMMVATIACQSAGLLVAALLSLSLLHLFPQPDVWRWFFAMEMLFALLFLRFFVISSGFQ